MPMRFLTATAVLFALTTLAQASEKLINKVYSVSDLVIPIEGCPGQFLERHATIAQFAGAGQLPHKELSLPTELVKLITDTVAPEAWSEAGGAGRIGYFPLGHGLVVNQTAEIHSQIDRFLRSLRGLQDLQVATEMRLVRVNVSTVAKLRDADCGDWCEQLRDLAAKRKQINDGTGAHQKSEFIVLDDEQVEMLFKTCQDDRGSTVMQAPKVTTMNGQQATFECGEQMLLGSHLQSRVVKVAAKTESTPVFLGTRLEMLPVVSGDRSSVAMKIKASYAELAKAPASVDGELRKNTVESAAAAASGAIPSDKTMLVVLGTIAGEKSAEPNRPSLRRGSLFNRLFRAVGDRGEEQIVLLLVTPRIVDAAGQQVTEAPDEKGAPIGGLAGGLLGGIVGNDVDHCEHKASCCEKAKRSDVGMNLADVVALSSSGVSDEIIINQILTTETRFKLGTEDILFLKKNKVSDRVVLEMQNTRPTAEPAATNASANSDCMPYVQAYDLPPIDPRAAAPSYPAAHDIPVFHQAPLPAINHYYLLPVQRMIHEDGERQCPFQHPMSPFSPMHPMPHPAFGPQGMHNPQEVSPPLLFGAGAGFRVVMPSQPLAADESVKPTSATPPFNFGLGFFH